jgi:hypothetical protein
MLRPLIKPLHPWAYLSEFYISVFSLLNPVQCLIHNIFIVHAVRANRYRFPASLQGYSGVLSAIATIINQLNISQDLQSFNRPPSFPSTAAVLAFPLRYVDPSADRTNFQNLCKSSVY